MKNEEETMKRRFRLVVTWLCMLSVAFGTIPGTLGAQAASSGSLSGRIRER